MNVVIRTNCPEPPFSGPGFARFHGKSLTCSGCLNLEGEIDHEEINRLRMFPEGCICPQECDCAYPRRPDNAHEGVHYGSMFCPECNDNPNPHDQCPIHGHMSNFEFNAR